MKTRDLEKLFGKDATYEDFQAITGQKGIIVNRDFAVFDDGTCYRLTKHGWKEVRGRYKPTSGYTSTYYKGTEMSTHRLVAYLFIPNPSGYPEVNHLNGIKTDNRASNLEWCNRSMNMIHAYAMGLH